MFAALSGVGLLGIMFVLAILILCRPIFGASVTSSPTPVEAASGEGPDAAILTSLTFQGATGVNTIQIPTNLADALSCTIAGVGDWLQVTTTTGAVAVTITTSAAGGVTFASHVTMGDAKNVILNTTTGTKIGTAVGQKLGFWNATPVVQPSGALQAALTNSTGGSQDGTLAACGDTTMANQASVINDNFTDVYALLTAMRTALVDSGIMKGAA